jgi:L-alanine-DL-glutamate epimerase-like enolase superfamily enzyme
MIISVEQIDLKLAHTWAIASRLGPGGGGGTNTFPVLVVKLIAGDGLIGLGEAAPSSRYGENVASNREFLDRVDPSRLSYHDIPGSMAYLELVGPGQYSAKCAVNIALLDGAARRAGKPIYEYLGIEFSEGKHVTSFSIGIAAPDVIRQKVAEAAQYPFLKLKVGGPDDRMNLAALRDAAPDKWVRVDANEGWKTREEALRNLEWLASDGHIELVEQPMPATTPPADLQWLRERSPLPLMADESYLSARDINLCADCYHAVNVKLVKTAGITGAHEALLAARKAGLKTMIGCMIETSILITAAAHLAELTDYLDIDGNLLITNDPYTGATADRGVISFAKTAEANGLRVRARMSPDF